MNRQQLDALIKDHPGTVAERIAAADTGRIAEADAPTAIVVGTSIDNGNPVVIDLPKLIAGRLLIQGNSGAGKSMLLRRIFEQAFGRIQQLMIDGEGEFSTLAEVFDLAVVTAEDVERISPEAFAKHIREHRYSAVLDLSDATAEDRLSIVARLAKGLIDVDQAHWHPMLVLVDEVQALAPFYDNGDATPDTRKASIVALAELMSRGRKRGLAGVVATARIAETSKAVVAKATNAIIGRTIFDRDMERAGALLGFTAARASALRSLGDGEFIAIGPAIAGPKRVRFRSGPVKSEHKGRAPDVVAPPKIGAAAVSDLLRQVDDAPVQMERHPAGVRGRGFSSAEDEIITQGYRKHLQVREIADQLEAAGHRRRALSGISSRARDLGLQSDRAIHRWTDEEDEIIANAYAREVKIIDIIGLLSEAGFDRGRVAIQMRAIALGITRDRVNYWTEPEKEIAIRGLKDGTPYREIIANLKAAGYDRGMTGILKFAQKNNFSRAAEPWTAEQIEELKRLYAAKTPVKEIVEKLGKPIASIRTRASNLGLKQRIAWSEAEYKLLTDGHAAGKTLTQIALEIGRPYPNVARVAVTLQLNFKRPAR